MKNFAELIQNRNDFEDYIYENEKGYSTYHNGKSVYFSGGLFVFEETNNQQDGFEMYTTTEKKYCTIEKVRRVLLEKEAQGEKLENWDHYEQNQGIAGIVLWYGA